MKRLLAAVALTAPAGLPAQRPAPGPDSTVALAVTLDSPDWHYRAGDTARYTVTLTKSGKPIPGARVRVELGRERLRPERVDTVALTGGTYRTWGTLREPGFYRLTARADVGGATYTAMATAGFDVDGILPTTSLPDDFMQFWNDAIAEARRTPLDARLVPMPERSTKDVAVYHVNFANHKPSSRIYGILSVPTAPGRYPAILNVPGAGVRPYFPSIGTARRGIIVLSIGIHGIPVDRDSLLYNELRATALEKYRTAGVEDRDEYYYKRVFQGVVRAGDFIHSLPQFDGEHYHVQGGSQGGGLAIVTAVLDPRVDHIAVSYPAMADHNGYFHGRAGGWPHVFQDTARVRAKAEKIETLRYYDVANFARLLKVPGIYTWGYNDNVVPPTSVYAAYNVITAPKERVIAKETGHYRERWQDEALDAWVFARLRR